MIPQKPHFLLFSQAITSDLEPHGHWHFVLEPLDGGQCIEASDAEPNIEGERLELLAVVRGLEALDQPSSVTLVTSSQQVTRGFRTGLEQWRANDWKWERFGQFVPVKNQDLWQRINHALNFHRVECRTWRFDPPHAELPKPRVNTESGSGDLSTRKFSGRVRGAVENLKTWVMGEYEFGASWARTA